MNAVELRARLLLATPGVRAKLVAALSVEDSEFTEGDFEFFFFAAFSPLNYSQELIGQAMGNGCTFGDFSDPCYGGPSGDFNLFTENLGAPLGTFYFELTTNGGNGDAMAVTSMLAVPEAGSWALMLAGFGIVGAAVRRRGKLALTA